MPLCQDDDFMKKVNFVIKALKISKKQKRTPNILNKKRYNKV